MRNSSDIPERSEPADSREATRLMTYVAEGLIDPSWRPLGKTVRERLGSIEAKAYTTWLRNADPRGTPEERRLSFAHRHIDAHYDRELPTSSQGDRSTETSKSVEMEPAIEFSDQ